MVAALAGIAILAGTSTLGGGLAVAGLIGDRIAEGGASDPAPTPNPEPWSMTADEVVDGLREDHGLEAGLDISDELCATEVEEDELFSCTMAVETDLVRVISFDDPLVAATVALSLLGQEEPEEEGGAVDYRSACHIVLIWFEGAGMDEGVRTAMTEDVEDIVGC